MNDNARKIFDMLGIEPDEWFYVPEYKEIFRLTEELNIKMKKGTQWTDNMFKRLLLGEYTIEKLPFVPQRGEKYWFIRVDGTNANNISRNHWGCYTNDYICFFIGNCFRTQEEAEKALKAGFADKIREKYKQALAKLEAVEDAQ
ncbi:MAG: hypothetical protein SPI35_07970 [Porphyromonas sp.]|nr:hypothetical protein [Porphyromonas sp.]